MAQSKTAYFRQLLEEGMSIEDAKRKAEVSESTARTQYYKWKKEKGESQE